MDSISEAARICNNRVLITNGPISGSLLMHYRFLCNEFFIMENKVVPFFIYFCVYNLGRGCVSLRTGLIVGVSGASLSSHAREIEALRSGANNYWRQPSCRLMLQT